jgi:thymidylate kinase
MESQALDFHSRVYDGYKKLAEIEPERFIAIEASGDPAGISIKIQTELNKRME